MAKLWLQESVSSEVRNLLPVSALSWLPHSLLRYLKKKLLYNCDRGVGGRRKKIAKHETPQISPLEGTKHTYVSLAIVKGILRNWESLCDIRPDCHHHFDASETSNAMFDDKSELGL